MTKRTNIVKIFYCYAPQDQASLDGLEKHFKPLKRQGQVGTWGEYEIPPGANRDHEIEHHLREADVVLLLVSPDFLASDHCQEIQRRALELREANYGLSVIPIILRPVLWKQGPIEKFQPLPRNEVPISKGKNEDEAFVHVVEEIKKIVDLLLTEPQQPSDVKDGFFFIGQSPTNGYRWDNDLRLAPGSVQYKNIPDAPWLVSQAVGILELSHRYSIFGEKNVLRDFAKLSPTAEAIQQFANRYGYLADGDLIPLYYPDGKPDNNLWFGESLQIWTKEISEMNMLVTLWEMIKDKQIEALREHIIWELDPMGVLFVWQSPKRGVIASDKIAPELFYRWKWGEVIRPALHYLCAEINAQMRGHINPTLFPPRKMEMYMVPDSLRSALYVLLSMEVREHLIEAE